MGGWMEGSMGRRIGGWVDGEIDHWIGNAAQDAGNVNKMTH